MVTSRQVQEYLDVRHQALTKPETFQNARRAVIESDKADVFALFESRLQVRDEEERCSAIARLASLYGSEATDTIVRWINDSSMIVRWVVGCCLHDYGDLRAESAFLDRLKHDADCEVRGVAAGGLGQIGAIEALPDLHQAYQTDLEVDELGYSSSGCAHDAMTSVLRSWVSRQIQGTPPRTFRETTRKGLLLTSPQYKHEVPVFHLPDTIGLASSAQKSGPIEMGTARTYIAASSLVNDSLRTSSAT